MLVGDMKLLRPSLTELAAPNAELAVLPGLARLAGLDWRLAELSGLAVCCIITDSSLPVAALRTTLGSSLLSLDGPRLVAKCLLLVRLARSAGLLRCI